MAGASSEGRLGLGVAEITLAMFQVASKLDTDLSVGGRRCRDSSHMVCDSALSSSKTRLACLKGSSLLWLLNVVRKFRQLQKK